MAPTAPPPGFVDLATAYKAPPQTILNIIGVVNDVMQPTLTQKGQWMFTFKLLDQHLQNSIYGSEGYMVRFFKDDPKNLPQIGGNGDVVLLRTLKSITMSGQPMAISNYQTRSQVFLEASIPAPNYSIAYQGTNRLQSLGDPGVIEKLSLAEQAYVIHLKAEVRLSPDNNAGINARPAAATFAMSNKREAPPLDAPTGPAAKKLRPTSTFGNKFMLVKETEHRRFADLCVQVVKKFSNQFGSVDLYVTDYTENKDVWYYPPPEEQTEADRDGDSYGYSKQSKRAWPGPYGWLTLKVNVKDPHSHFVNHEINEGDLLLLKNVKMKIMAEGAKLEGDMWRDDQNPAKVNVRKLISHGMSEAVGQSDVPEIKDLLARKEKYWARRATLQPPPAPTEGVKQSKSEKKRAKKQRQQEERAVVASAEAKVAERNKHVRCSNEEIALMSVKDILDPDDARHTNTMPDGATYVLPFVNTRYRTKAHVVDYWPKKLEDFAVSPLPDEDEVMSPIDAVEWDASRKWEWYFSLLLEDPVPATKQNSAAAEAGGGKVARDGGAKMWVHVRHEDAQFLFGNDMDDPQDLRSNTRLLAKLKEKLCILWGNLEERSGTQMSALIKAGGEVEELSNKPFECCIQEYGIELDGDDPEKEKVPFGYKKLFRIFGTTIL